jgi:hypothetical protein
MFDTATSMRVRSTLSALALAVIAALSVDMAYLPSLMA